jgi:hypothetical protein
MFDFFFLQTEAAGLANPTATMASSEGSTADADEMESGGNSGWASEGSAVNQTVYDELIKISGQNNFMQFITTVTQPCCKLCWVPQQRAVVPLQLFRLAKLVARQSNVVAIGCASFSEEREALLQMGQNRVRDIFLHITLCNVYTQPQAVCCTIDTATRYCVGMLSERSRAVADREDAVAERERALTRQHAAMETEAKRMRQV